MSNNLQAIVYALLWLLFLFSIYFYSQYVIYTAQDQTSSIDYQSRPHTKNNTHISLSDVFFAEDFIKAQDEEWKKDPNNRHCPSGILSPYLATMNQLNLSNHSTATLSNSTPVIFFDDRILWPKFHYSLPTNCPYRCIYTNRTEDATNASIAVFTRTPTAQYATLFSKALWAFDSNESPLRMQPVHQEYRRKFSIFLTSNPNSTIPKPYGLYSAFNRPECVMSQEEREHLFHHVDSRHLLPSSMATKTRLVVWLASNMYAMNQRKFYVAQLRRHVPVDIYGYRRLNCSHPVCLEELGRRYKFYLAIENSNCRAYITEKLFNNSLRHDMVPIVMGGRPDDYFNLAPPNSYIHVDDFHSPAHLAEYLRYLDGNDTAYAAFFAWKRLGSIRKASMTFCRLCALYHHGYLQQQGSSGGDGVHLGHFEEHLNPWNLCIGSGKWPSINNSAFILGLPLPLLLILSLINWCLRL